MFGPVGLPFIYSRCGEFPWMRGFEQLQIPALQKIAESRFVLWLKRGEALFPRFTEDFWPTISVSLEGIYKEDFLRYFNGINPDINLIEKMQIEMPLTEQFVDRLNTLLPGFQLQHHFEEEVNLEILLHKETPPLLEYVGEKHAQVFLRNIYPLMDMDSNGAIGMREYRSFGKSVKCLEQNVERGDNSSNFVLDFFKISTKIGAELPEPEVEWAILFHEKKWHSYRLQKAMVLFALLSIITGGLTQISTETLNQSIYYFIECGFVLMLIYMLELWLNEDDVKLRRTQFSLKSPLDFTSISLSQTTNSPLPWIQSLSRETWKHWLLWISSCFFGIILVIGHIVWCWIPSWSNLQDETSESVNALRTSGILSASILFLTLYYLLLNILLRRCLSYVKYSYRGPWDEIGKKFSTFLLEFLKMSHTSPNWIWSLKIWQYIHLAIFY